MSFIFVVVCSLFKWKRICAGLLSFVYICIAVGDSVIKRGGLIMRSWDSFSYQEGGGLIMRFSYQEVRVDHEIQLSRGEGWSLDHEIQLSRGEGWSWDPINWFNPTTFLCLELVIVWFVDIDGIVDHHSYCLNFLTIVACNSYTVHNSNYLIITLCFMIIC